MTRFGEKKPGKNKQNATIYCLVIPYASRSLPNLSKMIYVINVLYSVVYIYKAYL
jgi:hypothetical protein